MKPLMEGNAVLVLWEDGEYRPETIVLSKHKIKGKNDLLTLDHYGTSTKHIPITPETVERLGFSKSGRVTVPPTFKYTYWLDKHYNHSIDYIEGEDKLWLNFIQLHHIKSIADLQNLIYLLTGEMPEYRTND